MNTEFKNTNIKNTFQRIPKQVIEKQLSPKAVYLLAKLEMLQNNDKHYSQRALGINPISKRSEMDRDTISSLTNELEAAGFITTDYKLLKGNSYPTRIVTITPLEGYFKPVYNDFINNPELSPAEKGFAIILSLLDEIPSTYKALQKATGVSDITCKKYINTLTSKEILVNSVLSRKYFPNLIEDALEEKYQNRCNELKTVNGSKRIQNKLKWLDELTKTQKMPISWLLKQLDAIKLGTWERGVARKEAEKLTNTEITL